MTIQFFRSDAAKRGTLLLAALTAIMLLATGSDLARADEAAEQDTNRRLYEQLEGSGAALGNQDRIEYVSGQPYLSQENIDAGLIQMALDRLLDLQAVPEENVAIRRGSSLNFEIHFPKNSAVLTAQSEQNLDQIGAVLTREYLEMHFVVGGHTDLDGDPNVNRPLSKARAEAARSYLIERHSIAPERLEARGYGSSEPLHALEQSDQDKRYNRRVDLRPVR
jgi:outer membrane protein OmpA-like peptidoglycan-associated protein